MKSINDATNLAKDNRVGVFMFYMVQMSNKIKKLPDYKEKRTYYGVNVFKMREIVKISDIKISNEKELDSMHLGIVSLRDDLIPLINLPKWLGFSLPATYKEDYKMIVCDFNNSKIALLVAEPYRIEMKSWEEIGESNSYKFGEHPKINNHTKTTETDEICFILDIEQLLSEIMTSKEEQIDKDIENTNLNFSWVSVKQPIMIAEDSRVAQNHLKRIFTKINVKFELYKNGKLLLDALEKKGRSNKDIPLIITDLEMPIVSGHKVIQEVRKYNKTIPIIVNTSMTSENNRREVIALGATDFIGKTDTKKIIELIQKYVKK